MYIKSPSYLERTIGKIRQKILNKKFGTVFTPEKKLSNWPYILLILFSIAIGVAVYFIEKEEQKCIDPIYLYIN